MREVFIVASSRTPLGSYGGALSGFSAVQLGSHAIKGALEKAGVPATEVQEVFFGNVIASNLGQAPARQAALGAGLSKSVPCTTVNKVCASGTKSTMFGAMQIMLGLADVVVTGGMESMSNTPFYLDKARFGYGYGNGQIIDGLAKDGLVDAYGNMAMGVCSDATAVKHNISREQQDEFAINSYKRSAEATQKGYLANEISPISIPQKKGDALLMTEDEEYKKVFFDKIPGLKPAFTKDGTTTAANASTMNDGAVALVLASGEKVKQLGLKPIARIVSFADAAQEPEWFTTAPVLAAPIALKRAGLDIKDIDVFEVNEAFATVVLAFVKHFNLDLAKVNQFGGAISIGHPLGASGARIIGAAANVLQTKGGKYGLVAICNGGGGAAAMVIEKV
jgi:acetyl-CoA C-acetyltransferase